MSSLSFSLRVSSGVKSVHLIGSWDNYTNQLPLSRDKNSSSGKTWRGQFRFSSKTMRAGERYWYYYIVDGYHCAVNPSVESTVESTTGRQLNVVDVTEADADKKASSKHSSSSKTSSSSKHSSSSKTSSSKTLALEIPKGRPLSVSQIKAPKPVSPVASGHLLRYNEKDIDALAAQLGGAILDDEGVVSGMHLASSPASSTASSGFYRSDSSSPSSSSSGYSTPSSDYGVCSCENYGITRRGDRVKIDCGGRVCGYSDEDASSDDCASDEEAASPVRRRGVVFN
jgi:hypothetical protein